MAHRFGGKRWAAAALVLGVLLPAAAAVASGTFGRDGKRVLPQVKWLRETLPYGQSRTLLVESEYRGRGAIFRVLGNGRLDRSFGDAGKVEIDVTAAAVQRDGTILVLDNPTAPTGGVSTDPVLTRLLPNGSVDRSFGADGALEVNLGSRFDKGSAVAVLPDGRIAIAGETGSTWDSRIGVLYQHSVIERLLPGGAPDRSFGQRGRVIVDDLVTDIEPGPRGSIVALGDRLTRLRPGGALDGSFGKGGRAFIPRFGPGKSASFLPVSRFDVFPDGGILITGTRNRFVDGKQRYQAGVIRLRPDGALDRRFGGDGTVAVGFRGGWTFGDAAATLPGGGVLVLASSQVPPRSTTHLAAISLRADGRLDERFGQRGKLRIDYGRSVNGVDLVVRRRSAVLAGVEAFLRGTLLTRVPIAAGARR